MFPTSTQRKHWMLGSETSVIDRRLSAYNEFIERFALDGSAKYLTFEESELILRFFEKKLSDFCNKFRPHMPRNVFGTSHQYFKRFYLSNSVMDYHPKEILVTSAYLACKAEEFNVTMEQFVANINGNKERATEIILNHELLLMEQLNFHITVHNPWRPVEGLIIDIKTRLLPDLPTRMDVETFRSEVERFLDEAVALTNATLIYAPSQIALAALIHGASKNGHNLDVYVTELLFVGEKDEVIKGQKLRKIIDAVRNIRVMVKNIDRSTVTPNEIRSLFETLEKCRNQDNNPDSQAYKRKIQELLDDDDERGGGNAKMARYDSSLAMGVNNLD